MTALNRFAFLNPPKDDTPPGVMPPMIQDPVAVSSVMAAQRMALMTAMVKDGTNQTLGQAEMLRIINLPIHGALTPEEVQAYSRGIVLAKAHDEGFRLWPCQAEACLAYDLTGGGLFPVGVGWGKTFIGLITAGKAYTKHLKPWQRDQGKPAPKVALFAPANIMAQLVDVDLRAARSIFSMPCEVHVFWGKDMSRRKMLADSQKVGLYIFPYSLLSTPDAQYLLDAVRPTTMILDECHYLSATDSARTKRVMRYIEQRDPEVVAMSGTITSKTIKDYFHLARAALKTNNPLPNSASLAIEWGSIIDAQTPDDRADAGALTPLIDWARANFAHEKITNDQAGFRKAYKLRLNTAPGVVVTGDQDIGVSLTMHNVPVEKPDEAQGWQDLCNHIDKVETEKETPNGDIITYAIHAYKWLYELSTGFYNQLLWPSAPTIARRLQCDDAKAVSILERARQRHALGQEFDQELRGFLDSGHIPNLDTPLLVMSEISRTFDKKVPTPLAAAWKTWHDADFEHCPVREPSAVRVCPYKIDAAVAWAKGMHKGVGGIIWYYHQEVGTWLTEALRTAGVDALHCPAGEIYNEKIINHENANRIIAASFRAHGEGKNLQHFQHQYFLQWPRAARMAEQTLGRLHRNGQKADELIVVTNNTTEFDELNFAACLVDSLYDHQTTGSRKKLIYCSYDPLPRVFPPAVLREKGMENKILTAEQQRAFDRKFLQGAAA